ncbi:PspC domain-containing protein [Actinomadura scrupuli]|uniref:PspC domain-containing protein n=1 Tax=Actinomadura scrupuli TaxID=559629 RepID=UPI003D96AEF4
MNTTSGPSKQLVRTHEGRMVAGVCSGTGEYLGIDPNIVRLALAVFTLLGGSGILVYALGWLLVPEEGKDTSIVQELINKQQQKTPQKTP